MRDRAVDLLEQIDQPLLAGQRAERGRLVHRIARIKRTQRCLELGEERVGHALDHDETLGRATGLAGIVHPAPDCPGNGQIEIGILQHDERVAAAQFHRGHFEVFARARRDAAARLDASGQRDALDAQVVDHRIGLRVADQQIGIEADRRARLGQHLFERDRALRHDPGMFHHHRIARHQMRAGDAGKLVIGEIPRLDAEDHADRAALHMRFAIGRVERDGREEALRILGVIGHDPRAELDFAPRLADALAHLGGHDAGEFVGARVEDFAGSRDDLRAVRIGGVAPCLEAGVGRRDLGLELLISDILKGLDKFSGGRIEALIGHGGAF